MKRLLTLIFLSPLLIGEELKEERFVSELSITELTEIVRNIVEESIEQCVVSGTMEGRAKVNLKVEGEIIARMECEFEDIKKLNLSNKNTLLLELEEFADSCTKKKQFRVKNLEAIHNVKIMEGIVKSSKLNKKIYL